MKILIINGPNLNLLGTREPDIYGFETMESCLERLAKRFPEVDFLFYQSNIEGELINRIQKGDFDSLIFNFGAYTHYSYALADCLKNLRKIKIEVHISNLYQREEFRHHSVTAPFADALLSGFGLKGYELAAEYILSQIQKIEGQKI